MVIDNAIFYNYIFDTMYVDYVEETTQWAKNPKTTRPKTLKNPKE